MIQKNTINNELVNKNYYLHKALNEAHTIIAVLEAENTRLKDVLVNLASVNNEDLKSTFEASNDRVCTV